MQAGDLILETQLERFMLLCMKWRLLSSSEA